MSDSYGPAKSTALFRPSAATRWLRCAGSVALCAPLNDSAGSDAAREGTAVHLMSEKALRGEQQMEEWLDRSITVDGYVIQVTDEMVDGGTLYVDYVNSLQQAGAEVQIEQRLDLELLDATDPLLRDCKGTADCVAFFPAEKRLEMVDLKFGHGYMVPANTPQLKLYALMAMLQARKQGRETLHVRTTIVQPRDPNESARIRSADYDVGDLWLFAGEVCGAIFAAMQPNALLNPGDEQCMWCPAKGSCPALAQQALEVARTDFAKPMPQRAGNPMPSPGPAPIFPDPQRADVAQLAAWLDRRAQINAFFEGVERRVAGLLTAGARVPGYKMVPRTGNRKWNDPEAMPFRLREWGLTGEQIYYPPKLRTPKQIQDLLPKERHEALASFVSRPDNGLALVSDGDDRTPAKPAFGVAPKRIKD